MDHAAEYQYGLPAFNINNMEQGLAIMEAASELNAPVIIQFSNGGALFNAGKSLNNENQKAAVAGAISGAMCLSVPT